MAENPQLRLLKSLLPEFPQTGQVCLVGGAPRDLLLNRTPLDFDLTCNYDPTPLARAFARECGGHWFWLDETRRQSRVVVADGTFDFAPWRAPTLDGDLAARDYTINAMAMDMAGPLDSANLIDPLGGQRDLSAGVLRSAGPGVLADDPLRVLKGIRHAIELDLKVEPSTLRDMQTAASGLDKSAPERLRLEFWRILSSPAVSRGLELLAESGVGAVLLGDDYFAGLDMARHVLRRTDQLHATLANECPFVTKWLCETVEQGLDRKGLLRWHCALAISNPERPLILAHRWRFSRAALSRVAALRKLAPLAWHELMRLPCRPRPVALWALQFGPDPLDLLLALGILQNDAPDAVSRRLAPVLDAVSRLPDPRHISPLVDGRWLKRELNVEGAGLGAIQSELRRAEIRGEILDADDARHYLVRRFPESC